MSNVIAMTKHNQRDWKYLDKRLTELRGQDIETILERGRVLSETKEELEHGSWEATVKRHFTRQYAHVLMTVAKHPVISNVKHALNLPPSAYTLYLMTKLSDELLKIKLKDGSINPKTERKDVTTMLREQVNVVQPRVIEAFKQAPNGLASNEVYDLLPEVSPTTIRGCVYRLRDAGQLKATSEQRNGANVLQYDPMGKKPEKPTKSAAATEAPAETAAEAPATSSVTLEAARKAYAEAILREYPIIGNPLTKTRKPGDRQRTLELQKLIEELHISLGECSPSSFLMTSRSRP